MNPRQSSLPTRPLALDPLPRNLGLSIRHAKGLAAFLARLEGTPRWGGSPNAPGPGPARIAARAWLFGRAQEVECVVLDVTRELRSGSLREGVAARTIDSYLAAIHKGLARHFGERFPTCCAQSSSPFVGNRLGLVAESGVVPRGRATEVPADELLEGLATRAGW